MTVIIILKDLAVSLDGRWKLGPPERHDNSGLVVRVLHPQISDLEHREQILCVSLEVYLQSALVEAAVIDYLLQFIGVFLREESKVDIIKPTKQFLPVLVSVF